MTKKLQIFWIKIFKLNYKKKVRKYYLKYYVTEQWNNLPLHIVTTPSMNTFKNCLWEQDGVMHDPDITCMYETTSTR